MVPLSRAAGTPGRAGVAAGGSRLLDLRDCERHGFAAIHRDMLRLDLGQQPRWIRPWLARSRALQRWTGHNHWSRAWEYPWAVLAAGLGSEPLRALDVGGGGSPFPLYLAERGHECDVADPSLDRGVSFVYDRGRGLYRNARSLAKRLLFAALGIRSLWGLPPRARARVRHHPFPADRLEFPDATFDRVFCLSVMEHVPRGLWPASMREMQRVLRPGGRLILTLDMDPPEADARLWLDLARHCDLALLGDPSYPVPVSAEDRRARHPGHGYETIGLVWAK